MNKVKWRFIDYKFNENHSETVLVVCYEEKYQSAFWVRCSDIIDVVLRRGVKGPVTTGYGAKKYENEVREIVQLFKQYSREIKVKQKHPVPQNIIAETKADTKALLKKKIDKALDCGNKAEFMRLSSLLNEYKGGA